MNNINLLKKLDEAEYSGSLALLKKLDEADNYWKGEFDNQRDDISNQPRQQLKTALTKVGGTDKSGISGVFGLIRDVVKLSGAESEEINRLDSMIDNIAKMVETMNIPTKDLSFITKELNKKQFIGLTPPIMSLENLALNMGSPDDLHLLAQVLEDRNQLNVNALKATSNSFNTSSSIIKLAEKNKIIEKFLTTKLGQYIRSVTQCTKNGANIGRGEVLLALLFQGGAMPNTQGDVVIGGLTFELKGNGGSFKPGVNNSTNNFQSLAKAMGDFFNCGLNGQKSMVYNKISTNIDITNFKALEPFAELPETLSKKRTQANGQLIFRNLAKAVLKDYLGEQYLLLLDNDNLEIPYLLFNPGTNGANVDNFIDSICNGNVKIGGRKVYLSFNLVRGGSDYRFTLRW